MSFTVKIAVGQGSSEFDWDQTLTLPSSVVLKRGGDLWEIDQVRGASQGNGTSACFITDSNTARRLLNFDFVDSGVMDFEFRRLLAALESVLKQAYVHEGRRP